MVVSACAVTDLRDLGLLAPGRVGSAAEAAISAPLADDLDRLLEPTDQLGAAGRLVDRALAAHRAPDSTHVESL